MNTALWLTQAILGGLIFLLGLMKTFLPGGKLKKFGAGDRQSLGMIRFIGVSELLIGAGLILPWLTGILPMLTWLAAVSLCLVMVLAIGEHIKYKEPGKILLNLFIICLAAFVAVGRFVPAP